MKLLETLKAVALVGLAIALEAGFLLQIAVPPAEVLRAVSGAASVETLVRAEPALAPPQALARRG